MTNSININPTNMRMEDIRGSYYLKGTVSINGKNLAFTFDLHNTYNHVVEKDYSSDYIYEPRISVDGLNQETMDLLGIKFNVDKLTETFTMMKTQFETEKKLKARNDREANYDSLSIVMLSKRIGGILKGQGFAVRQNSTKKDYVDNGASVTALYVEQKYKGKSFDCSIYSGRNEKFEVCVQRAKTYVGKDEKILSNISDGWKRFVREIDEKIAEQKEKASFMETFKKETGLTLTKEEKSSRNEYARGNEPRYRYYDVFSFLNEKKSYSFTTSENSGDKAEDKNTVHFHLSSTVSYEKLNEILAILNSK